MIIKNWGGSVKFVCSLAILAFNTEKSLVKCTVKDDSVRTPPKNPYTSTNITLPHVMQSVNQKEKILDHFFHSVENPFHEQIYRNLTLNLRNSEVYIFS